jgi:translation initiation factor IF-1
MTKEALIEFDGTVVEVLPDSRYRVKLDNGHETMAYVAGRVKKNRIRIIAGDRVMLEMTPYDLSKSRITFRHRDERAAAAAAQPRQQWRRR